MSTSALPDRERDALTWLAADPARSRPVCRVRCATQRHKVGDVYRIPSGFLWRGQLPPEGVGWDPSAFPRALRPQEQPSHWSEASWHTISVLEKGRHVYWGCRCTGEPYAWLAEDAIEAAEDRTRSEVLIYP